MARSSAIAFIAILAVACGGAPEAEVPPDAAGPADWIEVPLSDNTFRQFEGGYRQDTVLASIPTGERGVEYEIAMNEGDAIVYNWELVGTEGPEQLFTEFHGHPPREEGKPGTLMFYRRATGGSEYGTLTAPFTGLHGWYFRNDSDLPALVRLTIAGFYQRVN